MPDVKFKTNMEIAAEEHKKYSQAVDFLQQVREILNDNTVTGAAGITGLGMLREKYLQLEGELLANNHTQTVIKAANLMRICSDIAVWSKTVLENPITDTSVSV